MFIIKTKDDMSTNVERQFISPNDAKPRVRGSDVPTQKLNELIDRWERIIYGIPSDHDQVVAIQTCINDLKITVSVHCH